MLTVRPAGERGHADHGWLDSHHTFSFAEYYDPNHMGLGPLRVINDDRVAPGRGFGTHPHRDMEIISYVLEGALEHKDSMGTGSVIRPGDVQRMSAGTGVAHSEFNGSKTELVHFLQIWLIPHTRGLTPSYEQRHFTDAEKRGTLRLIASHDGRDGSITVHTHAEVRAGLFDQGEAAEHPLSPGGHAWIHVARGRVRVNGQELAAGDGAAIKEERSVKIEGLESGEVLLFDLA
jgi:redox-sensitive bicupin YhaK (pirin superfamily)